MADRTDSASFVLALWLCRFAWSVVGGVTLAVALVVHPGLWAVLGVLTWLALVQRARVTNRRKNRQVL